LVLVFNAIGDEWIFALAGAGSVLIAALTVSYQAFRAATANPAKSIRGDG
jgi:putative ABC transport system permease protein